MVDPPGRALLDSKRVRKKASNQTERKDHNGIQHCEKNPRLEIAYLVRQALPSIPKRLQIPHKRRSHRVLPSLEQRVDERRQRRALRENNENSGDQDDADDRQKPPALVSRKEREQFSRNPKPPSGSNEKAHRFPLSINSSSTPKIQFGERAIVDHANCLLAYADFFLLSAQQNLLYTERLWSAIALRRCFSVCDSGRPPPTMFGACKPRELTNWGR